VSTRTDARHYALGVSATQICINGAELASKFLGAVLQLGGGRAQGAGGRSESCSNFQAVHTESVCSKFRQDNDLRPISMSTCILSHLVAVELRQRSRRGRSPPAQSRRHLLPL